MDNSTKNQIDYGLTLILFLLAIFGCVAIHIAQDFGQYEGDFLFRQIGYYIMAVGIILGVIYFDSEQIFRMNWFIYLLSLLILIVLIFSPESIAREINGAKSWFQIPGFGSLQPAEFSKISLIICLSYLVKKHKEKNLYKSLKTDLFLLIKMGVATLLPILLIMKQPDLGTALVLLFIFIGITFISGISWKIIAFIYGMGIMIISTIFYLIFFQPELLENIGVAQYQFGRIYAWIDPESYQSGEGYNLMKALLAIGAGGTSGYRESHLYVPEAHTDFIFSVVSSKFGFIGASTLITIYFLLIYKIVKLSLNVKDIFDISLCTGVISMITFHVFENIGMNIGLMPITGIPLPFISYGGSAMIGNSLAMGLIFTIAYRNKKFLFN